MKLPYLHRPTNFTPPNEEAQLREVRELSQSHTGGKQQRPEFGLPPCKARFQQQHTEIEQTPHTSECSLPLHPVSYVTPGDQ